MYSFNERSRWILACVSSRPTDAFACNDAFRTFANGADAASSNKASSHSGATTAAEETRFAFAGDNLPVRTAASVLGRAATRFEVSNSFCADATDVPAWAASCSAADRYPSLRHAQASSARRASSTRAEPANRSNSANSEHSPGVSNGGTASGSSVATIPRNASVIARSSHR